MKFNDIPTTHELLEKTNLDINDFKDVIFDTFER